MLAVLSNPGAFISVSVKRVSIRIPYHVLLTNCAAALAIAVTCTTQGHPSSQSREWNDTGFAEARKAEGL